MSYHTMQHLPDVCQSPESDEEEEEVSEDEEPVPVVDLLDRSLVHPSLSAMLEHLLRYHQLDLDKVFSDAKDEAELVQIVNYLRQRLTLAETSANPNPNHVLKEVVEEKKHRSAAFMRPTMEDDSLLYCLLNTLEMGPGGPSSKNEQEGNVEVDDTSDSLMMAMRMKKLETDLTHCQEKIVQLMSQSEDFVKHQAYTKNRENRRAEETYFGSYEHVEIHEEMIRDQARTDAYRDALVKVSKNKAIMDVGCGTGILSLFAARAGAKRVVGIDASAIAEAAKNIVKANGFEQVVKIVRSQVEDLDESLGKFDVLVSEWMGYGLFFESMLDSVLVARDRYLDKENGGIMVPSHASIFVQGLSCANSFWDEVYGFDFSYMKDYVPRDEMVITVKPEDIVTNRACVREFDLAKVTKEDLDFIEGFSLDVQAGERKLSGIVVSFDCRMTEDAVLSTAVGK